MSDILIDHDSVQYLALIKCPSRDLLNLGIPFDLKIQLVLVTSSEDSLDSLKSQICNQISPSAGKLSTNAALQGKEDLLIVVNINRSGHIVDDLFSCL